MPDPRNYMRDRGLADDMAPPSPQPAPWGVDLKTGKIVDGEAAGPVIAPAPDLPNDYAARDKALEYVERIIGRCEAGEAMSAARLFHAFLTATEVVAGKSELHTFTDE